VQSSTHTPIVFLIFNRPETTRRVFNQIRRARPPKLLVVADGPRMDRASDVDLCAETRDAVKNVDWPCQVLTRFCERNLGCRENVSLGLDWAFEQLEEAIILEDDCLPDPTFFPFCDELLERYRDEPRVAQICGSNYQQGNRRTAFSYYFSRHAHIWGWATWRRSWQLRDLAMSNWPQIRDSDWLRQYTDDSAAAFYWRKMFDDSHKQDRDSLNSWAVPWTFSCWRRGAVSIIPEANLVSNIGYSGSGTHTSASTAKNQTEVGPMKFPLQHPPVIQANIEADRFTEETFYFGQDLPQRLFWKLRVPLSISTVRRLRRWGRQFR
jgi:hypothetical protein